MTTRRAIHRLVNEVIAGDPLAIGIAVVMGAAMLGIVVIWLWSIGRATETIPPPARKKLRWPEDAARKDNDQKTGLPQN